MHNHASQGDDFALGLAEGGLLKGDKLINLRLAGINLGDEGACKLAKAFESVGEWDGALRCAGRTLVPQDVPQMLMPRCSYATLAMLSNQALDIYTYCCCCL